MGGGNKVTRTGGRTDQVYSRMQFSMPSSQLAKICTLKEESYYFYILGFVDPQEGSAYPDNGLNGV